MSKITTHRDIDSQYLASLSILFVEDEDDVREQLTEFLKRRCRKVYTAANGKIGLEVFSKHRPDIVVTDILMPVMDGLKMSELIKKDHPHVPIILVTAFEEPRYFHKAIDLGVHQYVNKPVKTEILHQALLKCARILRAECALKEVRERYRLLFKLSNIAISVSDAEHRDRQLLMKTGEDQASGALVDCNQAFLDLTGYHDVTALQEQEKGIFTVMTEKSADLFKRLVQDELLLRGFTPEFELELINSQGELIPVVSQLILRYSDKGEPMEIWAVMRDISERRKAEQEIRLAAKVFECSRDAIIISDRNNKIISVNKAFTEITGYQSEEAIGNNPCMLKSGQHDQDFYRDLWDMLDLKGYWQGEIWNRRKNGEIYPEWLTISVTYDQKNQISHYIGIFSDITETKATKAHIEFLANFDPLTKLPNRRLFVDRLEQAIKVAAREKKRLAVLFFDLDHFKAINDSLGHGIGDKLLVEVAKRLAHCMREQDSVSRLSGDEFAAIITDITDINAVMVVAKKIVAAMREGFKVDQYDLHVTSSTGISIYPNDGLDQETLLKNADVAMYSAKRNGRDDFEFFSPAMSSQALERLSLETSLRNAIDARELQLYYQPQVDIESGKIIGIESLLRWPHCDMGMILPNKFITLAEETGLIMDIGKWVLTEACRQNKAWQDQGMAAVPVTVNLSAVQFRQHNFLEILREVLRQTQLEPHYLELELTENILMDCPEYNVKCLHELRRLGVQLAIDDFGTGYTSLSYLKRFPINRLKIDQSFIQGLPHDSDHAAITSAIISLGHDLGLCVIAEGVESKTELNFLTAHQCDEAQGFLLSPPVPKDEMMELLAKRARLIDEWQ